MAEVLCQTVGQKVAKRGHNEDPESGNKDNFFEIMKLISENDIITKARLSFKCAKYTSPSIQN